MLRVTADRPADAAQSWLACGAGWRVESTFELTAGWDAALEGQPDAQYDRALSTDFPTYANVYRRWVLNEDASFAGPAFDIGAFFGVDPVRPQPLRFGPCVTLDDTGQPRPPIVEFSTDSGASWSTWPDSVGVATSRAAIYFGDATLPAAFLAAAKAGTAKVRVTAGLQSPQPVRVLRWRGNPFAGTMSPRTFDLADAFAFRRVDDQSIHHDDVRDGVLVADEIDQSNELLAWLVERMRHAETPLGRATLTLSGMHPALRIGDRLIDTTGPGTDTHGDTEAIARRGAIVHRITHRFAAARPGPDTAVELRF